MRELAGEYWCNECKNEIKGSRRYHCTECSRYDLCESCQAIGVHPEHWVVLEASLPEDLAAVVSSQDTFVTMLWSALQSYANRPCLGIRKILSDGSVTPGFEWKTYEQIRQQTERLSYGLLVKLSLAHGTRMGICGKNSIEWFVTDMAVMFCGLTTVPLHIDWDLHTTEQILLNSGVATVFCDSHKMDFFLQILSSGKCPLLKHVFCLDVNKTPNINELECQITNPEVYETLAYVPDDILAIIYTRKFELEHVYTRLCRGGRCGICPIPERLFEDIKILGPTSISSTPRFWNVLHSQYQQAFALECAKLHSPSPPSLAEVEARRQSILAEIRSMLGPRITLLGTGGAYTSPEVKDFLKECWGDKVRVVEGYGSTEAGSIAGDDGKFYSCVTDYKILDLPELGYSNKDLPYPRGELLLKTSEMTPGYFNNPEANSSTFDSEGWYHTGDIVALIGERQIKIIDRIKNIFKLAQGEFVEPQRVEQILEHHPLIAQAFVTCGTITKYQQNSVAAVLVLSQSFLQNLPSCSPHSTPELGKMAHSALMEISRKEKLRPFEVPRVLVIADEPFTVENGLLTSSNKINRLAIERKYRDRVDIAINEAQRDTQDRVLASLVSEEIALTLGVDQQSIRDDTTWQSIGGDSLSALRLVTSLKEKHNVTIPVELLLDNSMSLGQIFKDDTPGHSSVSLESLFDDVSLESLSGLKYVQDCDPTHTGVFITGCTGFVGIHLLAFLLKETTWNITCLVRCDNKEIGFAKLSALLASVSDQAFENSVLERVQVIPGDLSQPRLALTEACLEELIARGTFATVFHVGAWVNHAMPYSALRATNVFGTKELAKIALQAGTKCFIHVSSVSTADDDGSFLTEINAASKNGYATSKWCAEMIVQQISGNFLLPVITARLGMVCSSTETGYGNKADWLHRLIAGCVALRAVPQSTSKLNLIPVDSVARLLHFLSTSGLVDSDANRYVKVTLANSDRIEFTQIANWLATHAQCAPVHRSLWLLELHRQLGIQQPQLSLQQQVPIPPATTASSTPTSSTTSTSTSTSASVSAVTCAVSKTTATTTSTTTTKQQSLLEGLLLFPTGQVPEDPPTYTFCPDGFVTPVLNEEIFLKYLKWCTATGW
ncbi:ATP/NADPH-dependent carboxylic acid reductase [Pelomyxa schiedti]|nr:ATP/NADPH-dependent carboxylic acid reductase [Pelomyxa schiedti]